MSFDIYEAFCNLSAAFGPSGRETDTIQAIREVTADNVQDIGDWNHHIDTMNNLIYHRKGSGKKILLAAHMDSIGIVVTHIDDKGFARFAQVGGFMLGDLIDRRVCFQNGTRGVISFEEKTEFSKLGFDNRIGCVTLIGVMAQLAELPCDSDVYVAFTAQEEVGLRGAQTAAFAIQPEYAIAVDVTDTGDLPERKYPMAVKMGEGPTVKIMDHSVICDQQVKQALYRVAQENDIPVQREIMEFGGTDTGAIQRTAGGVKVGAVSIPTRYIHSAAEMANLRDVEQAIRLIAHAVSDGMDKT